MGFGVELPSSAISTKILKILTNIIMKHVEGNRTLEIGLPNVAGNCLAVSCV